MNQLMLNYYLIENNALKYMIVDQKRKYWVMNYVNVNRYKHGEYIKLFKELKKQPKKFFEYFRISPFT